MKKTVLIAALGCFTAAGVHAQNFTYGPEVGLNIANQTIKLGDNKLSTSSKIGFKAGAVANIPAGGGFYLQPGLFFSTKGSSYDLEVLGIKSETETSLSYIELPLNILYRIDLGNAGGIFVSAGGYAAAAVAGKVKNTVTSIGSTEKDIEFGSDAAEMKRFDFGLNGGVGYETPWGVYIRAQYGYGLANLVNMDNSTTKNTNIQISLGYLFNQE